MNKSESFLQLLFLECEIEHILDEFYMVTNQSYTQDYYQKRAEMRDRIIDIFRPKKEEKK